MKRASVFVMTVLCVLSLVGCSAENNSESKGDNPLARNPDLIDKSELLVLESDVAEDVWEDDDAEFLIPSFGGNTSDTMFMELTNDTPYWQVIVKNTGDTTISVETQGNVHWIEPSSIAVVQSTEPWPEGTYYISFGNGSSMQGKAVCFVSEAADFVYYDDIGASTKVEDQQAAFLLANRERLTHSDGETIDLLSFSSGSASTESTSDTTGTIITDHPTNGEGRIDHFIFEPNPGTDDSLSDVPDSDTTEPIITDHPTNGEGRIDHVIFWPDYETDKADEQDVQ